MRICLLSYRGKQYSGGQGIYIYYLARELQRMGHHVEVIGGPPYPEVTEGVTLHRLESSSTYHPQSSLRANLPRVRNPVDLYELLATRAGVFADPLAFSLRAYSKLKELFQGQRFDIIHDNQGLGYGLLLMKRLKVPVIATIHHPLPIDKQAALDQASGLMGKWRLQRFYSFVPMQSFVAQRLDRVITVSQSAAKEIERLFKVAPNRLRVVYDGTDTSIFRRNVKKSESKNGLIMVGNTDDRKKGVIYLLKALQLLKEDGIKLTIVDEAERDSAPSYALKLVEKFGLDGLVKFTGRVTRDELVEYYSSAEVAVVPSLYEGFGLPAAEAMSCKLPVITTKGGALPEVVGQDGDTGILVPPADPDALAVAIKRLLSDEPLRREMGEAGRKRVERNFTWEQAAKKTLEVYEEVL